MSSKRDSILEPGGIRLLGLHNALSRGDAHDAARFLRECGNDVNAVFGRKHTPATQALEAGCSDVILEMLFGHKYFDVNAKNLSGRTPLYEAALRGRSEAVRRLLQMGANVDDADLRGVTPLSACAIYNRPEAARLLLAAGADVNSIDSAGDTVLHRSCAHGSEEMVTLLLEDGRCDVNALNNNLETPLMMALPSAYNVQVKNQALTTSLSICRKLLAAGSSVFARELRTGGTALHERVRQGDVVGLCLLLDHRPRLADVPDGYQGKRPLLLAAGKDSCKRELAVCLLQYGADSSCLLGPLPRDNDRMDMYSNVQEINSEANAVKNFYKLRFLRAFLSSVFFTADIVSKLTELHLLTEGLLPDVLAPGSEDRVNQEEGRQAGVSSRTGERFGSSEAVSDDGSAGASSASLGHETGTVSPSTTININNETRRRYTPYHIEVVACVRAAIRQSMSLKHQCRLAIRRLFGTRLRDCLPHLGLPKILQVYLNLDFDAEHCDPFRVVQLHVAITNNDVSTVKQLLEAGTNPNAPLRDCTPLTCALEYLTLNAANYDYVPALRLVTEDIPPEDKSTDEDNKSKGPPPRSEKEKDDILTHAIVQAVAMCNAEEYQRSHKIENAGAPGSGQDMTEHNACKRVKYDALADEKQGCVLHERPNTDATATSESARGDCDAEESGRDNATGADERAKDDVTSEEKAKSGLNCTERAKGDASSRASQKPKEAVHTDKRGKRSAPAHKRTDGKVHPRPEDNVTDAPDDDRANDDVPAPADERAHDVRASQADAFAFEFDVAAVNAGDDIIMLLLRHGASPLLHDPKGDTPLDVAVRRGSVYVYHLLMAVHRNDEPSQERVHTEDEPSQERVRREDEPSQERVHTKDEPSQERVYTKYEPSQERVHTEDEPSQESDWDPFTVSEFLRARDLDSRESALEGLNLSSAKALLQAHEPNSHEQNSSSAQLPDDLPSDTKALSEFLQEGIQVKNRLGLTPPQMAVLCGSIAPLRLMLGFWRRGKVSEKSGSVQMAGDRSREESNVPGAENTDQDQAMLAMDSGDTGISLLHCAAAAGAVGLVSYLLSQGVRVDLRDKLGHTPLHAAACRGLLYAKRQKEYCPHWQCARYSNMLSCWPTTARHRELRREPETLGTMFRHMERLIDAQMQIYHAQLGITRSPPAQDRNSHSQSQDNASDGENDASQNQPRDQAATIDQRIVAEVLGTSASNVRPTHEVSSEGQGPSEGQEVVEGQFEGVEFSYPLTVQILLQYGADLGALNKDAKDVLTIASKYKVELAGFN